MLKVKLRIEHWLSIQKAQLQRVVTPLKIMLQRFVSEDTAFYDCSLFFYAERFQTELISIFRLMEIMYPV